MFDPKMAEMMEGLPGMPRPGDAEQVAEKQEGQRREAERVVEISFLSPTTPRRARNDELSGTSDLSFRNFEKRLQNLLDILPSTSPNLSMKTSTRILGQNCVDPRRLFGF